MRDLLFKYTNAASRFLVLDRTMVHYRDEGTGPVIILLHGAFSSLHTWNEWVGELKKQYRVVRFDMLGFGLTGPTDDHDYSMDAHIRALKKIVDILGLDHFHIAGSSLGGWLAWEFALKYPNKVDKLILIDAAGFLDEKSIPAPFKLVRMPIFGRMSKYVISRPMMERYMKQVFFDESKVAPLLVERYYDLFAQEGNLEAFYKLVNTRPHDNTHKLKKIQHHTLVMWGEYDEWIPMENAYNFHSKLPHSQLIIYPDCGHLPMEELPDISVADAIEFLEEEHPEKEIKIREAQAKG